MNLPKIFKDCLLALFFFSIILSYSTSSFGKEIDSQPRENLKPKHLRISKKIDQLPLRWVYVSNPLSNEKEIESLKKVANLLHRFHFNGIVLRAGFDSFSLKAKKEGYGENLKEIRNLCDKLKVDLIPYVFSVGYAYDTLLHDKNLAVGFPVKKMRFVVKKQMNHINLFQNGGIDDYVNDIVYDFSLQDLPSIVSFVDKRIKHSGAASIRFQDFFLGSNGNGRIKQRLKLEPNRKYVLSCWIKVGEVLNKGKIRMQVLSPAHEILVNKNIQSDSKSWERFELYFNSQNYPEVDVYIGVWDGDRGVIWIDDISIKPQHITDNKNNEKLIAIPDESTQSIYNSGFEVFKDNVAAGYLFHDGPDKISYEDTSTYVEGKKSIRFENFNLRNKHGRVCKSIDVIPYRQYVLSCWIKKNDFTSDSGIVLQIYSSDKKNILGLSNCNLPATKDWTKVEVCFNSMDNNKIIFYGGTWTGQGGKFWIDNLNISQGGLLNVIRREGAPLKIEHSRGYQLKEGLDFKYLKDTQLNFKPTHTAPVIEFVSNASSVKEGDTIYVSFYHGLSYANNQTSLCMSEEKVYTIWREQIQGIEKLLSPKYYFLGMDEIRQGGTDESDMKRNLTLGQILGGCISKQFEMIKEVNPKAEVFIWSDMLDPNQNARSNYCQIEGSFEKSWKYIPDQLNIVCWNYHTRKSSIDHFISNGFRVMGAVYYDHPSMARFIDWLQTLNKIDNKLGIMYTTWKNDYAPLSTFYSELNNYLSNN